MMVYTTMAVSHTYIYVCIKTITANEENQLKKILQFGRSISGYSCIKKIVCLLKAGTMLLPENIKNSAVQACLAYIK